MFSEKDETIVDYNQGSVFFQIGIVNPIYENKTITQDVLMSSYMIVRNNCEEACSQKLLSDLSDTDKSEYRSNTRISQNYLKTLDNPLMKDMDSCIRRCFGI